MNRRIFLKSLAGLPLLGFAKPEDDLRQVQLFDIVETKEFIQWDG